MWHCVQWLKAFGSQTFKSPPSISPSEVPPPSGEVPTIRSLFAFDGAAPELINGRLAMIGILAAACAEVSSGEGVIMQASFSYLLVALSYGIALCISCVMIGPCMLYQPLVVFAAFSKLASHYSSNPLLFLFSSLLFQWISLTPLTCKLCEYTCSSQMRQEQSL
jgi:hypothetical protein